MEERLVAPPVQLIEVPGGVILKRGVEEVLLSGEPALAAAAQLLAQAGAAGGSELGELRASIESSWPDVDAAELIAQLRRKAMLVDAAQPPAQVETPAEILGWNLGITPQAQAAAWDRVSISLLGVNTVSRHLAASLTEVGARVRVVDIPELRNVRLFSTGEQLKPEVWNAVQPEAPDAWERSLPAETVHSLVVCSDFGGLCGLEPWNALAVERGWHFLPVVLQNTIGLVGPLVIPGETACFACLLARELANSESLAAKRAAELCAFEGQTIAAYHPSMACALADVAAIELTKHYAYGWPSSAIGNAIELNLLAATMKPRPILKVPGCEVCSSRQARSRLEYYRVNS